MAKELREGYLYGVIDGRAASAKVVSRFELRELLTSREAVRLREAEVKRRGLSVTVEDLILATIDNLLEPDPDHAARGRPEPLDVLAYIDGVEVGMSGEVPAWQLHPPFG